MIYRSRAPLRLGLAGGGTDVSPYSDIYGGAILNATISLFAYATIEPREDGKISFIAYDRDERFEVNSSEQLEIDGKLDLLKGVYNYIVKDYIKKPLGFTLSTYVDAPAGSGLGTSSTLVVAILGAFAEWLKLPFGEYDLAQISYKIEREDLEMAGGKQDQYTAAFGGVNFMQFLSDDRVIVNPLRIKQKYLDELEFNLLLYYTGTSRLSSTIIEEQSMNVKNDKSSSIEAMHKLKEQAYLMKEAILKGKLDELGEILNFGWEHKKKMAASISNAFIDEIYDEALKAGANGGKVSGAGGGGFMMLYCPQSTRFNVMDKLNKMGGEFKKYNFVESGLVTWKI
ncbi:MAG TPA: dehydrogenase [Bacteroidetes bacterium]|nr:dehydrogenase [Bacteroidota bacterium]